MSKPINEAGTSQTAPGATDIAERSKIMVLAVHYDTAGKLVITPIDVEHEQDDQRDLTPSEVETGANMLVTCRENEEVMKNTLAALYTLFYQRLYREKFRSFENFCFAVFGTHRIEDTIATKAKARVNELQTALEGRI
jgi:hypothetical protein